MTEINRKNAHRTLLAAGHPRGPGMGLDTNPDHAPAEQRRASGAGYGPGLVSGPVGVQKTYG